MILFIYIQNRQIHRQEIDQWFPGAEEREDGKGLLMGTGFLYGVMKMF